MVNFRVDLYLCKFILYNTTVST